MRFLVVSAFLACAAAAPHDLLAPVAVAEPAIPTLSPGDIQAAAIDAQVKARDLAIAAADKARELDEQAAEKLKEASEDNKGDVMVGEDAVKEDNKEAFWAAKDMQWQALDALKTAEAQMYGALARDAPVLAKNAVAGIAPLTPYLAGIAPVAPVAPIVYIPGFVAPLLKSVETSKPEEAKPAEQPAEKTEALMKSTEEKPEMKDSVTMQASTKNLEAKPQLAPLAIQPYYNQGYPLVALFAPMALSSSMQGYGAYHQVGLAPTNVKTAW